MNIQKWIQNQVRVRRKQFIENSLHSWSQLDRSKIWIIKAEWGFQLIKKLKFPYFETNRILFSGGRASRLIRRSVFLGETDNGEQNRPIPYRNYNGAGDVYAQEIPHKHDPGHAEETGSD